MLLGIQINSTVCGLKVFFIYHDGLGESEAKVEK